jgi:hypothetical protein
MIEDSRAEPGESGILQVGRPLAWVRDHDPVYRLSMVVATTVCTRYRQVMAAIKG